MGVLDNISPQQKKLLMYGVPAVALVAVGLKIGRRGTTEPAPAAADPTVPAGLLGAPASATDVLGIGQLADFESTLTGALGSLGEQIKKLQSPTATVPTGTVPHDPVGPGSTPTPAPALTSAAPIWPNTAPLPVFAGCPDGRKRGYVFDQRWTCWTPAEEYGVLTAVQGGL